MYQMLIMKNYPSVHCIAVWFNIYNFFFVSRLNVNRTLYDELRRAVKHGDVLPTTEVDDHVSKLFLFDFEQSGNFFIVPIYSQY